MTAFEKGTYAFAGIPGLDQMSAGAEQGRMLRTSIDMFTGGPQQRAKAAIKQKEEKKQQIKALRVEKANYRIKQRTAAKRAKQDKSDSLWAKMGESAVDPKKLARGAGKDSGEKLVPLSKSPRVSYIPEVRQGILEPDKKPFASESKEPRKSIANEPLTPTGNAPSGGDRSGERQEGLLEDAKHLLEDLLAAFKDLGTKITGPGTHSKGDTDKGPRQVGRSAIISEQQKKP